MTISRYIKEDRGVGLEPLLQEFALEPYGLPYSVVQDRIKKITGYYSELYNRSKNVKLAYNKTRKWAMMVFVQHHARKTNEEFDDFFFPPGNTFRSSRSPITNKTQLKRFVSRELSAGNDNLTVIAKNRKTGKSKTVKVNTLDDINILFESSIDFPRPSLDPLVWDRVEDTYVLRSDVRRAIFDLLKKYPHQDILIISEEIRIVGSITTNQYTPDSDIDVHIVPNDEFITENMESFVADVKNWSRENVVYVGRHPIELYIQLNSDQDLLGDGVYDLNTDTWLKGPKIVPDSFDPYAVYRDVYDNIGEIAKDSDITIGELKRDVIDYKTILEAIRGLPVNIQGQLINKLKGKLSEIENDIQELLSNKKEWVDARHNASKPGSAEQALQDLEMSKKWQDTNAMFKLMNRYQYIKLITDLEALMKDGEITPEEIDRVEKIIGANYV